MYFKFGLLHRVRIISRRQTFFTNSTFLRLIIPKHKKHLIKHSNILKVLNIAQDWDEKKWKKAVERIKWTVTISLITTKK